MNKKLSAKEFIDSYLEQKESEKTNFSRIVNKLLQVNYITKRKPADANDYRYIRAYAPLFQAYLALADFELHLSLENDVIYITNESTYNHLRLRKLESVMILVIRLIYQSKKDYVTLDEDVEISLFEIHDKLAQINYLDNNRITKEKLKPVLTFLRGYNIIDYIDRDLHDDARIKIYPTILYITNLESIDSVIKKLDGYMEGNSEDEETNEN